MKNLTDFRKTLETGLGPRLVNWTAKKRACDKRSEVMTKRCFLLCYSTHTQDNISIAKIQK